MVYGVSSRVLLLTGVFVYDFDSLYSSTPFGQLNRKREM